MQMHLIALSVPYPPNYGGSIDIFYKIKALHQIGVHIHLHCFEYGGRSAQPILEDYCQSVHYYKRNKWGLLRHISLPYIVSSRENSLLLDAVASRPAPVLMEGIHTSYYLGHPAWAGLGQWVRMHNIEWQYYGYLAQEERGRSLWRRQYYRWEGARLRAYEAKMKQAQGILAISPNEYAYLREHFPHNSHYLPVFHAHDDGVKSQTGRGDFLLYQANLSVNENIRAVEWLLAHIAPRVPYPIIIAGQSPSEALAAAIRRHGNVRLVANPSAEAMQALGQGAQIQLLPTFQPTGIKLKLLNALFEGRFCLANSAMVAGTGLESLCEVAEQPEEWIAIIHERMQMNFEKSAIEARSALLLQTFDNRANAQRLAGLMHGGRGGV